MRIQELNLILNEPIQDPCFINQKVKEAALFNDQEDFIRMAMAGIELTSKHCVEETGFLHKTCYNQQEEMVSWNALQGYSGLHDKGKYLEGT